MTTTAELVLSGMAIGDSTLVEGSAELTATDGEVIDSASVDADLTAIATDDSGALAMTGLESFTYVDDDGSGAGVSTSTSGTAVGDTAYSTSSTSTFAIATPGADVALGLTYSAASGDGFQDADASVEPYGDITATGGMDTDTDLQSAALAVGVAVDLA
jgi:hypothetical protein